MPTSNFGLYDFFVDVIPGAVAIMTFSSLLPAQYSTLNILSELGLYRGLLFIFISYVVGHFVQAFASPLDLKIAEIRDRDKPFERAITKTKQKDESDLKKRFYEGAKDFFNADLSDTELFFQTQSYLWNHGIGRMKQFQTLYTMFRGIWVTLFVGGILHLFLIPGVIYSSYDSVWSVTELTLISLLLLLGSGLSYHRRVKYHKQMIYAMIHDFSANVLSSE